MLNTKIKVDMKNESSINHNTATDGKPPVMGSYNPSWGKWECPTCKIEMLDPSDFINN